MPERMEKENGKIRDYPFCYVLNKKKDHIETFEKM